MRNKIIEMLISTLEPLDFVLALWQGGSAARGYVDEWSDIDIQVIVQDNRVQETFNVVETALKTISDIRFQYRMPEPTWHGHSQCFYQLAEVSPFLIVDFVVTKLSNPSRFLEEERHGKAVIGFDKANLLLLPPLNRIEHFAKMQERFTLLKSQFDFWQVFVKKEINRRRLAEAIARYHAYTLQPVIELLGMVYRPYQYDFGFRYINRDFPTDVVARVEPLFCVKDLADLAEKQQLAESIFTETLPPVEEMIQVIDNELRVNEQN
jgi:predicted nucleotidyltransferase